jgi:hypothetical protein
MDERNEIRGVVIMWLVVIFLSIIFIGTARCDHFGGADITWTCTGPNSYEVTATLYRDCTGAAWGIQSIYYKDQCTAANGAWSQQALTLINIVEITQACPTASTTCQGGGTYGIQRYTYRGTIIRTPGCGPMELAYTECCRNAVTNLNYPLNSSQSYIYVGAIAPSPCSPSPQWVSPAMPTICRQTPQAYNHGTSGIPGVTYSSRIVWCGVGDWPCTYSGGQSWTSPTTAWSLNTTTGVINWSNNNQGVYQFVVRASWAGGFIERDHQVRVIACNNDPPQLWVPPLLNPCPGQTINTGITATDVDGPFLTFGPLTYTAPTEPGIYYITAWASDGFCPIEGTAFADIPVYVMCVPLAIEPWMLVPDTIVLDPHAPDTPWWTRFNTLGQWLRY